MKPIELTLSGLQSYREQQVIDFEMLCENGLFGIFGPTGSGKSTILDAITLALYGKVERALNGTQGIMNQAENQLAVSFTFRLNGAHGARTFRVERRFKRTGDVTISNSVSRFIEIEGDSERVLADKLSDVTRMVEHHIGLKMDDFTRAVVLPQGKFAEFLSLKGSDRRQMLQRLFSLERYGDELGAKLARRVKETEAEVNTCVAEQQGLGDASAEALEQAELALNEAIKRHQAAQAAKEAAEARYKALEELRAWQSQRQAAAEQAAALEAQADSVQSQERQVKLSLEAEQLLPLLKEAQAAAQAVQLAEQRLQAAEAARQAAEQQQAAAAEAANAAKLARETREPELLHRLERLKQALEWQRDAAAHQRDADRCEAERQQAAQAMQTAEEQREQASRKLLRAAELQAELKEQLKQVERPLAERESSQAASRDSERLQEQRKLLQQAAEAQQQQLEQCAKEEAELRNHVEQLEQLAIAVPSWKSGHVQLTEQLNRLSDCVHSLAEGVDGSIQWTNMLHRQLTKRVLAAELADTLHEGEACPVCGSVVEHSAVQHQSTSAVDAAGHAHDSRWVQQLEQQLEQWNQLRDQLVRSRSNMDAAQAKSGQAINELSQRLSSAEERMSSFQQQQTQMQLAISLTSGLDQQVHAEASSAASGSIQEGVCAANETAAELQEWIAHSPDAEHTSEAARSRMEQIMNRAMQCHHDIEQAYRLLIEQFESLYSHKDMLEREADQLVWAIQQAATQVHTQQSTLAGLQQRCSEQELLVARLTQEFTDRYPGWELAEMEQLSERWLQMDREAEQLRIRLERGIAYVEETQQQTKQFEDQKRSAELQLLQRETELKGYSRMLEDVQKRLAPLLSSGPVLEQLQAAEQELGQLKQAYEQAVIISDTARAAATDAMQGHALAVQARDTAAERERSTAEQLQLKLADSSFTQLEDVEAARMEPSMRQTLEQSITVYYERRTEVHAELRNLDARIQGRSVTDEEWGQISTACAERIQEHEASFTARVKLERDAEQLRNKHARWMELDKRRADKQLLLGRLQQLQAVFRGNAFVEYVAEEQLLQVSRDASIRLKQLTKQRYALEVDSSGGFVIRDDGNGGIRRPVSTLSGGETFLTSLALALALSAQIQLRGMYPLEFFFLDEGFGTLDPELLDTVVTALEKLHSDHLAVGVISHVPELRARLPRKLIVQPAEQAGMGSKLTIESL